MSETNVYYFIGFCKEKEVIKEFGCFANNLEEVLLSIKNRISRKVCGIFCVLLNYWKRAFFLKSDLKGKILQ